MSSSVTFIWLTGHLRNIGDSMLRRPYAEVISEVSEIYVLAGDPSRGYAQGLRLDSAQLASSFADWYFGLVRCSITRRTNFAFNTGQISVTKAFFFRFIVILPWLLLAKLRGGKVLWVGAEIAAKRRGLFWPLRVSAWLTDLLYWRDGRSVEMIGHGQVCPDWGFSLNSGGDLGVGQPEKGMDLPAFDGRQYLGISLRGDRPYPSREWLAAVRSLATRHSYDVLAITQVEDDAAYAERIARDLDGEALLWNGGDHFEQELRVRAAYRMCAAVLSDRLHGLIIAATEGAVPIGWTEAATDKLDRHFRVVGVDWVKPSDDPILQISQLTREQLFGYFETNAEVVAEARERILAVAGDIQRLLCTDSHAK